MTEAGEDFLQVHRDLVAELEKLRTENAEFRRLVKELFEARRTEAWGAGASYLRLTDLAQLTGELFV